jgi:hypothetical protein
MHTSPDAAKVLGALGGKSRPIDYSKLKRFADVTDAQSLKLLLARTMTELREGDADPRSTGTISSLATIFLRAVEIGDIELRLKRIEQRDEQRERERRPN